MNTTWQTQLQSLLNIDWLGTPSGNSPCHATGLPPAAVWHTTSTGWQHDTGLAATWQAKSISHTRAFECFGNLIGQVDTAPAMTEALTLNWQIPLNDDAGWPWVRTYAGTSWIGAHFPPEDYQVADRQLIMPRQTQPLVIASTHDGWPSGRHLPIAIFTDQRQRSGLAMFIEWAGNWKLSLQLVRPANQQHARCLHIKAGIWGLNLALQPGQCVPLARVLVVPFEGNLQVGANALRRCLTEHICPQHKGRPLLPPVFYNTWLGMLDNISDASLTPQIAAAGRIGVEYFTIDAGWNVGSFRKGNGNWTPDPIKFPHGLEPVARRIEQAGMKMGLWLEGEWAHKDSQLVKTHPDWFLPTPAAHPDIAKPGMNFYDTNYLLMDFGLPQVRQWWLGFLTDAYHRLQLRWVRWDNNQPQRANWEHGESPGNIGWRQIRFVQGLYRFLDDWIAACPEMLIEQCASGGHRVELGMLRRGHTLWTCDQSTNTDLSRAIQLASAAILPAAFCNRQICIGSEFVTDYDLLSHSFGTVGFSGNLAGADMQTQKQLTDFVTQFKHYRYLLLGDFHLHTPPARQMEDPVDATYSQGKDTLQLTFNMDQQSHSARCDMNCTVGTSMETTDA